MRATAGKMYQYVQCSTVRHFLIAPFMNTSTKKQYLNPCRHIDPDLLSHQAVALTVTWWVSVTRSQTMDLRKKLHLPKRQGRPVKALMRRDRLLPTPRTVISATTNRRATVLMVVARDAGCRNGRWRLR